MRTDGEHGVANDSITLSSPGPDMVLGTEDDITIKKRRTANQTMVRRTAAR